MRIRRLRRLACAIRDWRDLPIPPNGARIPHRYRSDGDWVVKHLLRPQRRIQQRRADWLTQRVLDAELEELWREEGLA